MIDLAITAIELTNHGPVRGTRRFQLSESGLNVHVRPNECGKTTLLETVCAVLWGRCPVSKNWQAAPGEAHRAAIELLRRGEGAPQRLRIQRDFETHEVLAMQLIEGRPDKEIFHGTHNPDGRTADHRRWPEEFLPRLWAALSCDAFRNVAMLLQPAPEPLQTRLVQELVSGSTGTAEGARQVLVDRYRKLSKLSAQAGLSPRNARNDGELESLLAQRDHLAQEVSRAGGEFDQIEQLRARGEQLAERLADLERRLRAAEQGLTTVKLLRERKQELDRAAQQADQLQRLQREAQRAAEEQETARCQAEQLPAFLRELALPSLAQVEQELTAYRERRAGLLDPQKLQDERDRLHRDYGQVENWPDSAAEMVESLRLAQQRHDETHSQVAAIRARLESLAPEPDLARRALVGAATAVVAAVVLVPLGILAVGAWGGLAGALLAAAAAGAAWAMFHPQRAHPDRLAIARELAEAESRLAQACQSLEQARQAINWTADRDLPRLIRLAERRNGLKRERDALQQREAEQKSLQDDLSPQRCSPLLRDLLRHCDGDVHAAAQLLSLVRQVESHGASSAARLQAILEPLQCADTTALDGKLQEWTDRRAAARAELDRLARENALAEELADAGGAQIDARRAELERQQTALVQERTRLQEQQLAANADLQIAQRSIGLNLAEAEVALAQLQSEIQRVEARCQAIVQAHQLLAQAAEQYSSHHRAAIEARINELMKTWTRIDGRAFILGGDFDLDCQVSKGSGALEPEGMDSLSQGARDQLALAARLAVLERVGADVLLPLLIDDAFLAWDAERRQRLLETLAAAGTRQVILMSHDPAFGAWGRAVRESSIPRPEQAD